MIDRFLKLLEPDHVLFQQAGRARRLPNIIIATLMHLVFITFGLGSVLLILLAYFGDLDTAEKGLRGSGGFIAANAGMIVALWLWLYFFEKRPLRSVGLFGTKILVKYVLGFGVGLFMLAAVVGLMSLSGHMTTESGGANPFGNTTILGVSLLGLLAWMVQGGTEEVITRGWYLGALGVRYRPWVGVAVSSVLFSVLHLTANPLALLNLLLFGLFLALYCLREGSVWGVCGWHTAWNWTQVKLFGLSVSGHEIAGAPVMDLMPQGNPYMSGGDFGPEGSVYATLIFVLGITAVLLVTKPKATMTE